MRTIRLLILLLALGLTLMLALVRPIQGRAVRPAKRPKPHKTHHFHHSHQRHHELRRRHPKHPARHVHANAGRAFGHRVVEYARHFLGVRYSWGGSSPRTGFDCSGLVRFVYGHFGIGLPHSSFGDLMRGHRVSRRWLRPGDLVFFYDASHVGIYAGDGRFIDAPHSGAVVRVSTMQEYGYYSARRFRG